MVKTLQKIGSLNYWPPHGISSHCRFRAFLGFIPEMIQGWSISGIGAQNVMKSRSPLGQLDRGFKPPCG